MSPDVRARLAEVFARLVVKELEARGVLPATGAGPGEAITERRDAVQTLEPAPMAAAAPSGHAAARDVDVTHAAPADGASRPAQVTDAATMDQHDMVPTTTT